jgi:hypothetical protein
MKGFSRILGNFLSVINNSCRLIALKFHDLLLILFVVIENLFILSRMKDSLR